MHNRDKVLKVTVNNRYSPFIPKWSTSSFSIHNRDYYLDVLPNSQKKYRNKTIDVVRRIDILRSGMTGLIKGAKWKENTCAQVAIDFGFASDWLSRCASFLNQSESVVKQSQSNSVITFDTQLTETALKSVFSFAHRHTTTVPFKIDQFCILSVLMFVFYRTFQHPTPSLMWRSESLLFKKSSTS